MDSMSKEQREAVEKANIILCNAGLPFYSEVCGSLETSFHALALAGGNRAGSEYRGAWELARQMMMQTKRI